jgi:hypothetical protein
LNIGYYILRGFGLLWLMLASPYITNWPLILKHCYQSEPRFWTWEATIPPIAAFVGALVILCIPLRIVGFHILTIDQVSLLVSFLATS